MRENCGIVSNIRASCMIRLASQLSISTTANRNRPLAAARFSFFDFSPRRRAQSSLYFWSVKTWTAVSLFVRKYIFCVWKSPKERKVEKHSLNFSFEKLHKFYSVHVYESCLLHKRKCLPVNRLENKFWKIFNYFSNADYQKAKIVFLACRQRVNKTQKFSAERRRRKINIKEKVFPVNSWIAQEIV